MKIITSEVDLERMFYFCCLIPSPKYAPCNNWFTSIIFSEKGLVSHFLQERMKCLLFSLSQFGPKPNVYVYFLNKTISSQIGSGND